MSKHISIEDFGADMQGGLSKIKFGADLARIASTLRRFANLIEDGSIGLCTIDLTGSCRVDDFTTNTLSIKFFDKA